MKTGNETEGKGDGDREQGKLKMRVDSTMDNYRVENGNETEWKLGMRQSGEWE